MDEMMTPGEAAKALHMSPSRLRAITDEGMIYARKTAGGHRRYPESEVSRVSRIFASGSLPILPAAVNSAPAHEQLRSVWETAMEWVDQKARPLVHETFAQIEGPGCALHDECAMANLAFSMPDGRTRNCRLQWAQMLYLLGEHVRTGESLEDLSWAYNGVHPGAVPEGIRDRIEATSPYKRNSAYVPDGPVYLISQAQEMRSEPMESVTGASDALKRARELAHEAVAAMNDMDGKDTWYVDGEDEARRALQSRQSATVMACCRDQRWRDIYYNISPLSSG